MDESDVVYFRRRAADALAAGKAAKSDPARAAHQELARRYEEMAAAIETHNVVLGTSWGCDIIKMAPRADG